jgi:hypothetical protein
MRELLTWLRTAEEPDMDLDREVLWELFPADQKGFFSGARHISTMTGANGDLWFSPLDDREDIPRYTASLEMVMTLVGDDWTVKLCRFAERKAAGRTWATLGRGPKDSQEIHYFQAELLTCALLGAIIRSRSKIDE